MQQINIDARVDENGFISLKMPPSFAGMILMLFAVFVIILEIYLLLIAEALMKLLATTSWEFQNNGC